MGSASIVETYWTDKDAKSVYTEAVEENTWEYGSRYDTGTIASTDGFVIGDHTPMAYHEAMAKVDGILNRTSKRQPLVAIPLLAKGDEREVEVTVTYSPNDDPEALAAKAAKPRKGEVVTSVYRPWKAKVERVMRAPKVEVPKEKAVTLYRIIADRSIVGDGYASQADARAAAVEMAASGKYTCALTIDAYIKRESGAALLTITPVVAKTTETFKVTLEGAPKGTARAGWLFVGWAAS